MSATRKVNTQASVAKRKQAEQLIVAAEKALQTGIFKWSPDYEVAASNFDKAAVAFQSAGLLDQCVKAYKRGAFCYMQTKTEYSAAKDYEAAGKVVEGQKDYQEASVLYKKAADLFGVSGYNERRGEVYAKAAKALETGGAVKEAAQMLEEAVNSYEADDKEYQAIELYKKLCALYIEMQRYEKALERLQHLVTVFDKLEQPHNIDAAYLHIVVILLYQGKGSEANEKLNQFMNERQSFLESGEFEMASQLIDAVHSDSKEKLNEFLKKKIHNIRERIYAKLIKDMKPLGSNAYTANMITDQEEDDLLLGTPPRNETISEQPATLPPSVADLPEKAEITDDDFL